MGKSLLKSRWFIYAGMLCWGTSTAIFSKLCLDMKGKGLDSCGEHKFSKPWFENIGMFSGMTLCLGVFWVTKILRMIEERQDPKVKARRLKHEVQITWLQTIRGYFLVAIPSTFDLIGSGVMTMGLLFTTISVMQMLRGSMVLFSACLSVLFLRRKLRLYHWFAVCMVIFALAMVGVASVASGQGSHSLFDSILGCCLVIGSQFIQACQIVVEEHFLQSVNLPPMQIVGMEGFWGLLFSVVIVSPLVYAIPGDDCLGRYENTIDTFAMIYHNSTLLVCVLAFAGSCLFYNFFGMMVTFSQSAVHRTILEAVRTACIWVVDIMIYYFISEKYGEFWDRWGWLQLAGFALLILSMAVYNEAVHVPYFHYPTAEELEEIQRKKDEKAEAKRLAKQEKMQKKKGYSLRGEGALVDPELDEPGSAIVESDRSSINDVEERGLSANLAAEDADGPSLIDLDAPEGNEGNNEAADGSFV